MSQVGVVLRGSQRQYLLLGGASIVLEAVELSCLIHRVVSWNYR